MNKLYSLAQLVPIIQGQKQKGKQIVLVNGCFDLIHIGHIRYLKESKKKGDIVVLALNSDASVERLKGKRRPILNEKERITVLSSFSCVDYITVFDEDNVSKILASLKPHIHAKGADYTEETVPEKNTTRSYGGKIAITGGPKIKSTSEILVQIANKFTKKAGASS